MPTLSQTPSSHLTLSFKVLLLSISVLSAAIILSFSIPTITDFVVNEVPSMYNGAVSWLRPPYLYLVINCIIISILASSKLQATKVDVSVSPPPQSSDTTVHARPLTTESIRTNYPEVEFKYNGVVLNDSCCGYDLKAEKGLDLGASEDVVARAPKENETAPFSGNVAAVGGGGTFEKDAMNNKENEFGIKVPTEFSPSIAKPTVSSRFAHQRSVKASPEGGKTVLKVSNTKPQNTWKTLAEVRALPSTRHFRKSETWDSRGGGLHHRHDKTPPFKMTKAKTFKDRIDIRSPLSTSRGGGSGGGGSENLHRDPAVIEDELNRRVEAFIKKFNHEMRMQR